MQTMIVDQLVGQIVGKQGQYRVERLLGQSRLNAVYLARNLSDQKMVALTLYITPQEFPPDAYQRFRQRFAAAAPALVALQHAHILPVYESGEQYGYPYFITPYLTNGSLADRLRQQQRFSFEEVLEWLEEIVPAIQFAHNRGLVHGTLKPANLVLDSQNQVLVAGFGLMHVLQLGGILQSRLPYAHLLSLAETFLVAPEYLAPEIVEGRAVDKRSDIYALGCILFELLSGTPPFKGSDPLAVAQMHMQQPLPSLHLLVPELPLALVSVVHQALERNPERRFQQVSDVLEAFTQVVSGVTNPRQFSVNTRTLMNAGAGAQDTPASLSVPTNWQLKPPIVTGKIPSIPSKQPAPSGPSRLSAPLPSETTRKSTTGPTSPWQFSPPISTGHLEAAPANTSRPRQVEPTASPSPYAPYVPSFEQELRSRQQLPQEDIFRTGASAGRQQLPQEDMFRTSESAGRQQLPQEDMFQEDMFRTSASAGRQQLPQEDQFSGNAPEEDAWWVQTQEPAYLSDERRSSQRLSSKPQRSSSKKNIARGGGATRNRNTRNSRNTQKSGPSRRQVLALAATGGVVAAGALFASQLPRLHLGASAQQANTSNTASASASAPQTQAKTTNQAPAATQAPTKAQPPANAAKPGHTGTVVGQTTLLSNTAQPFLNPADGKNSLLIHLPNGNFVAYKQACTHEGVLVNYDSGTHTLICPAHGAIFDPGNKGAVLQGPAMTALPVVGVKVNGDGTVTTL